MPIITPAKNWNLKRGEVIRRLEAAKAVCYDLQSPGGGRHGCFGQKCERAALEYLPFDLFCSLKTTGAFPFLCMCLFVYCFLFVFCFSVFLWQRLDADGWATVI